MSDAHDITGGLDLLGDWLDAKGYTEEAGLCTKAMDEINRLRDTNIEYEQAMMALQLLQRAEADVKLRAENARLREALKPFALVPTHGDYGGPLVQARVYYECDTQERAGKMYIDKRAFSAARAAMGETE